MLFFRLAQKKPLCTATGFSKRYERLQRQSYKTIAEGEAAAKAIKASHPILQVGIYDVEKSQVTLVKNHWSP